MHDDHFEALADERRRALLLELLNTQSYRIPLEGDEATASDAFDRKQHATAMYHRHLPKLEACDLVQWDRGSGEVARGPAFDEIRPLLEFVDRELGIR